MTIVSDVAYSLLCEDSSRPKNSEATDASVKGGASSIGPSSGCENETDMREGDRPKSIEEGGRRGDGSCWLDDTLRSELVESFLAMRDWDCENEGLLLCPS